MFGLVVTFHFGDAESVADFDELVARTVPQVEAHEPGTMVYAVHEVEGHPLDRVFYELYRDRAAFDAHEAQDHVREFLRERERYVTSYEVSFLTLMTAKGVGRG